VGRMYLLVYVCMDGYFVHVCMCLCICTCECGLGTQILRRNTDRALEIGLCGVPSFVVDRGEVVWGQVGGCVRVGVCVCVCVGVRPLCCFRVVEFVVSLCVVCTLY